MSVPRRRFGCHLPVVVFGICEILDTQRQTFENVFLIYMTARRSGTMVQKYEEIGKRQNFSSFFFPVSRKKCIFATDKRLMQQISLDNGKIH